MNLECLGLSKEDFLNKTQDNSICLVDLGNDTWDFTETMGGNSFSVTIKMDEELDYKFLGAERKMLATRSDHDFANSYQNKIIIY
jgi:hypothetical protein